jgi:hypothetical protein
MDNVLGLGGMTAVGVVLIVDVFGTHVATLL